MLTYVTNTIKLVLQLSEKNFSRIVFNLLQMLFFQAMFTTCLQPVMIQLLITASEIDKKNISEWIPKIQTLSFHRNAEKNIYCLSNLTV